VSREELEAALKAYLRAVGKVIPQIIAARLQQLKATGGGGGHPGANHVEELLKGAWAT
jgi:hypothetical protein